MGFRTKQTPVESCTGWFYKGREITLTRSRTIPRRVNYNKSFIPPEKRVEAATVFAVTRNLDIVSQVTGVPLNVLKRASVEPWWHNIVAEAVKQKNDELDGKITDALDKGMDVLLDRIQNGEIYVDRKTGVARRVPISAKTVVLAADVLFDKRQLLRGEATSRSDSITPEQKLMQLKEQFEKLAKSKGINPHGEVIEGEATEAEAGPNEAEVLNEPMLSVLPASEGTVLRPEGNPDGVAVDAGNEEGSRPSQGVD